MKFAGNVSISLQIILTIDRLTFQVDLFYYYLASGLTVNASNLAPLLDKVANTLGPRFYLPSFFKQYFGMKDK